MKKHLVLIAVYVSLFLAACQKNLFDQPQQDAPGNVQVNPNHPMKDSLQYIINKYVAAGLPGVQVAVRNNDGFYIASSGYAKLETRTAFKTGTPSWLFSITKVYTAAMVLKMKERGLISLDRKLTDYPVPDIEANISRAGEISIRMLLNHSSGIADLAELPEFMVGQLNDPLHQPSVKKRMEMLKGKPLLFEPGTDFSYSNSNYLVLQLLLEKITGRDYQSLLNTEIITPLGLQHTWYNPSEQQTIQYGFPNYYFDRFANEQLENVSRWNTALANASNGYGGIAADAADVTSFFSALLNGQVVSTASLAEMKTWITGAQSTQPDYGLGLEYSQYLEGSTPQFGHEGDGIGCSTQVFYVPDNNSILYINSNTGRKLFGPYLFKITDMKNELCRYVARWR
ncbi:MAG: beta-lactamase family protein [Sphingobacteriales bacterium]|nr:beta-lactamase family protein [Sphingobacteriales bacterium]